jgi:hypothetical protein
MSNLFQYLLQRSCAGDCVELVKLKEHVPCEVEGNHTGYRAKIVEVVFDPLHLHEVNAKFKADGFEFDDGLQVIAVNEDGSILLWGGLNSVYHLRRGERIKSAFDPEHLAFEDLRDLLNPFARIKHALKWGGSHDRIELCPI